MVRFLCALSFVCLALAPACSSSTPDEFADPDVTPAAANPDGVAYPTDHLGGQKRSGKIPGDRIPNLAFHGYVDGDRSKGLQTISLADYYDPQNKRWKLLHIEVAATWCAICSSEADATVTVKEPLGAKGVAYLEVIGSGPTAGIGPSLGNVDDWMTGHHSNFSTALDVRGRRMATIGVQNSVMPWDVMIDVRTMEILDSSGGAPADLGKFDESYLQLVASIPPAY